mmetsp:Transcript_59409/g.112030  ORF Transcript_59409/g.112030 Transcript_59409/m.112030 type:complete len:86 (-) Transcript_59409:555-812(-)
MRAPLIARDGNAQLKMTESSAALRERSVPHWNARQEWASLSKVMRMNDSVQQIIVMPRVKKIFWSAAQVWGRVTPIRVLICLYTE